ncbi:MAG TPA: acetate/propionate family kinase [Methylotenera sp.]|nr:acetate/propionate family kinase [Methylotenera sp.]
MSATIVLALNCGYSSLKFGLYRLEPSLTKSFEQTHDHSSENQFSDQEPSQVTILLSGEVESIGESAGKFYAKDSRSREVSFENLIGQNLSGTQLITEKTFFPSHKEAILHIVRLLAESNLPTPNAIGHRVVHGGPGLRQHCLINDTVLQQLEAARPFAPLHNQAALSVIKITKSLFQNLPQMACFDSTFHAEMPEIASTLPISKVLQSEGIKRYGFHGLSCESIVCNLSVELQNRFPKRLVIAHLGNGASITAVKEGKSIDTSMGLTPTGGTMMGTRSGDLDPGVLIYLMREKRFDAAMLESLVDHQSGLLGISRISSDMRYLHEAEKSNPNASLAIRMFCYSVQKQIAAMISVLNGLDMLIFTGGIGENDHEVRAEICKSFAWFGISLDETKNRSIGHASNLGHSSNLSNDTSIHDYVSRCAVRVIASNEDEQIARHTLTLLETAFR